MPMIHSNKPHVHRAAIRAALITATTLFASGASRAQSVQDDVDPRRAVADEVIRRILEGEANPKAIAEVMNTPFVPTAETFQHGPVGEAPPMRVGPVPRTLSLAGAFRVAPFQLDALADDERPNPAMRPMQIGREQPFFVSSANAGEWFELPDGGRIWTFSASSPNASTLRLRIGPFDPPRGAELIVWNAADPTETYGPITKSRAREGLPYWTPTVYGGTVRLEYYLPPGVTDRAGLQVTGAILGYPMDDGALAGGGWNACQVDVTCESGTWGTTALSVAHIQFVDGGSFICSGAMVNRLPAFDGTPYFWTASHCISSDAVANTIEVYWLYQSTVCNGAVNALSTYPRTDGSVMLANASDPDYTLLGLTPDDIPGGLVWAGWLSGAPANPAAATEIHHPLGAPKSISHGQFEGNDNGCGAPINLTLRFDIATGGQAGGSSGAPVFTDATQQIRATVSCSETDLCSPSENAWEGRLFTAYPTLEPFMDAASTVYVNNAWAGAETGTLLFPWDEVVEGYFGVPGGGTIIFSAGTYPQYSFLGSKACLIRGTGGSVLFE